MSVLLTAFIAVGPGLTVRIVFALLAGLSLLLTVVVRRTGDYPWWTWWLQLLAFIQSAG